MLSININTPESIIQTLKDNFKNRRLSLNLTQEGLANKSGVSLGSLKRFESSGQISLKSLLKLAVILDCLGDFLHIAQKKEQPINSIDELLEQNKSPKKQRARIL